MDGVTLTPLKIIKNPKGDIFQALKVSESEFNGFGEAYFSSVKKNVVKGWKKHTKMTLNLIVVVGEVKFVIYDSYNFFTINLSKNNYQRLTISPNLWLGFQGIYDQNILLNLANIEHNPSESLNEDISVFDYKW